MSAVETAAYPADLKASWSEWRHRRLRAVTEVHGIAAGIVTDWLEATPREVPPLPGLWRLDGDVVIGELSAATEVRSVGGHLPPLDHGGEIRLGVGDQVQIGRFRVVGFRRVDDRGLRVYDPQSPGRIGLLDIATDEPDARFRVTARFDRSSAGETVYSEQTDGGRVRRHVVGTAIFELAGSPHELRIVEHHGTPGTGFVSFGDGSRSGLFPFRFLDVEVPLHGDQVVLDFNRAYLPPASFQPSYSCPLPLDGNVLDADIRAGERVQVTVATP